MFYISRRKENLSASIKRWYLRYKIKTNLREIIKLIMPMLTKKMSLSKLKIHWYHDVKDARKLNVISLLPKKRENHVQNIPVVHVVTQDTTARDVRVR